MHSVGATFYGTICINLMEKTTDVVIYGPGVKGYFVKLVALTFTLQDFLSQLKLFLCSASLHSIYFTVMCLSRFPTTDAEL